MKMIIQPKIWRTVFETYQPLVFKHGKKTNVVNLMGALAIKDKLTTTEIAKLVLSYSLTKGQILEISKPDISDLAGDYYRILHKRPEKNSYIGLLEDNFVIKTAEKGENHIPLYSLTAKGCLFVLGFDFSNKELKSFIKNSSKYFLFFAYLRKILDETSISFIKEVFVKPIQEAYQKANFDLEDDSPILFSIISQLIGDKIHEIKRTKIKNNLIFELKKLYDITSPKYLELGIPDDELIDFYPKDEDLKFFLKHHVQTFDSLLLNKVCREIRNNYEKNEPIFIDKPSKEKFDPKLLKSIQFARTFY